VLCNGWNGWGAIGGSTGVLQNEIIPPTQSDYFVTGKELRDGVAIRSRGNFGLIEQYEMVATVPAFDHWKVSKLASIAATLGMWPILNLAELSSGWREKLLKEFSREPNSPIKPDGKTSEDADDENRTKVKIEESWNVVRIVRDINQAVPWLAHNHHQGEVHRNHASGQSAENLCSASYKPFHGA
jgi:hypothetical protein